MVAANEPGVQYSETQLGAAWIAVMSAKMAEHTANQTAIEALAKEVYINADDRSTRGADLMRKKTRIDNDLIALGQVLEECRRLYPTLPEPMADGLEAV